MRWSLTHDAYLLVPALVSRPGLAQSGRLSDSPALSSGGEGTRTLEPLDCQSSALPTELRPRDEPPRYQPGLARPQGLHRSRAPSPPRMRPRSRRRVRQRSCPGRYARFPRIRKWRAPTTCKKSSSNGSERWADSHLYEVDADDPRPAQYVLCMYPYPSGPAHQGHVRNYTFGDLLVRHRTMQGFAVLSPFGFDSFGLPAENAAIRTGEHPRAFTEARIAELKASVMRLGAVYDWRREVRSHDPSLHPLEPGHLPTVPRGRPRLPRRGAGQLVPGVPDGPGQRAGPGRRDLRALG